MDLVQIGARNMQNFQLLKAVGKMKKPVLLKRGLANTIEEWIMSAEYIMAGGNEKVIFCERGIRTFEKYTRNTLDLSVIPILKEKTHLPIVIDPSHATGNWRYVEAMSLAAVAAGADGLIIEVHADPEHAWSGRGAEPEAPEVCRGDRQVPRGGPRGGPRPQATAKKTTPGGVPMIVRIGPGGDRPLEFAAPPSKSMGHRAVLAAGLATGLSRVYNLGMSQDIKATLGAVRQFGAKVRPTDRFVDIEGRGRICHDPAPGGLRREAAARCALIPILSLTGQQVEFRPGAAVRPPHGGVSGHF